MKSRSFFFGRLLLPAAALISFSSSALALTITKANNTTALSAAGSWGGGVLPTANDIMLFDSTITAPITTSNMANFSTGVIQVTTIGGAVTIGMGTSTFTLNNGAAATNAIDMSAASADLTLGTTAGSGFIRWASANFAGINVVTGRTLTFNSNMTNNGNTKTIAMVGGGNIIFNGTSGSGGATSFNVNGANVTMNNATSSWVAGSINAGSLTIGNTTALQNQTVTNNVAAGLKFGTGITSATLGNLAGTGSIDLTNVDTNAVNLTVGGNNSSQTYSGALSGAGLLRKNGTGTLSISNTSNAVNYLVTGGTLRGSGTTGNTNGGFGTGAIELQSGTLSAAMSASNTLSFGNALTVATGQTGTFNTPERMTWTGNVSGAGTFNIGVTTTVSRLDLHNSWTGFTGNANFTGSGGVRLFNNGGTFNTASFQSTALDLGGSVGFQPQTNSGGNIYPIGALSGSSATASLGGGTAGRATYSVGALNTSTSFAGAINGNSALTKTGTGTQTLTGNSSYTGATTITGGTLALSGTASISSSTNIIVGASTTFDVSAVTGGYTLASVQTISGTGTVAGAMSVAGTLSPGNSPGTLTTGSQTWLDGGDYNWQILDATAAAGTGYDTISITGALDLTNLTTANYAINLWSLSSISPDVNGNALNFSDVSSYSWVLASTSGGVTGFDAADFIINTAANNGAAGFSNTFTGNFAVGVSGNNLVLNYTPVPEPRAALLGGLGLLALLRRRRN